MSLVFDEGINRTVKCGPSAWISEEKPAFWVSDVA